MQIQAAEKKFTARQLKTALEIAKGAGFTADKVDSKCHDFKLYNGWFAQSEDSLERVKRLVDELERAFSAYRVDVRALPGCVRITWDMRAISPVVAANQD